MTKSKYFVLFVVASGLGLLGLQSSGQLSLPGSYGLVSSAKAEVGRPLTPVSVAGVSRRTARRTARR